MQYSNHGIDGLSKQQQSATQAARQELGRLVERYGSQAVHEAYYNWANFSEPAPKPQPKKAAPHIPSFQSLLNQANGGH